MGDNDSDGYQGEGRLWPQRDMCLSMHDCGTNSTLFYESPHHK